MHQQSHKGCDDMDISGVDYLNILTTNNKLVSSQQKTYKNFKGNGGRYKYQQLSDMKTKAKKG